jgi:hypothetical protein
MRVRTLIEGGLTILCEYNAGKRRECARAESVIARRPSAKPRQQKREREPPADHAWLARRVRCWHCACMSVQITVRDVPEKVRDELAARAARSDGWYVALAEALHQPLATLDGRLAKAEGPKCRFLTPDSDR